MEDLSKASMKFFSDQQLCYADILSPRKARARIEVSVINFLKILNSPDPAISDLPVVMEMCYEILAQEKPVMERELFYKLLCDSPEFFTYVVALLRCSRFSLGIMASSRGLVAG